jgi:hypothetical protein
MDVIIKSHIAETGEEVNLIVNTDKDVIVSVRSESAPPIFAELDVVELPSYDSAGTRLTTISDHIFSATPADCKIATEDCSIQKLIIPDTVHTVLQSAFTNVYADELVWSKNCTNVPPFCFDGALMRKYTGFENVKNISDFAFKENYGLKSFDWPKNAKKIPPSCFLKCQGLKEVNGIENVTCIGNSAFEDCRSLERFIWPEGCDTIPLYCFSNCNSLLEVIINGPIRKIEECAFQDNPFLKELDLSESLIVDIHDSIIGEIKIKYPFYASEE